MFALVLEQTLVKLRLKYQAPVVGPALEGL
jgi:hypothetical protein